MSDTPPPDPGPDPDPARHDHRDCVARAHAALDAAETGLRPSPARREVLAILLESHRALGAYDILRRLDGAGRSAQPPVAYRALAFLQAHGLVHRVERLNAYVACPRPTGAESHDATLLVCRDCRLVVETPGRPAAAALAEAAAAAGFGVEATTIEAVGLCRDCSEREGA
ncbi:MAG: Fur family transcriptional regulator [Paracoccaceae bacterium]